MTSTLVALASLALTLLWLYGTVAVALRLFGWASEQGFLGAAAYVACWVFFFPAMAGICLVLGLLKALALLCEGLFALGQGVGRLTERFDRGELRR